MKKILVIITVALLAILTCIPLVSCDNDAATTDYYQFVKQHGYTGSKKDFLNTLKKLNYENSDIKGVQVKEEELIVFFEDGTQLLLDISSHSDKNGN